MMTKSVPPAVQAAAGALRGDVAWLESVAELISAIDGIVGFLDHDDMAVMASMSQRRPFVGA